MSRKAYLISYSVKLVKEKGAMYEIKKELNNPEDVYNAIKAVTGIQDEAQEVFGVITLDTKHKITSIHEVSRGTLNSNMAHPREIFKIACLHNASGIILFHNHPSGDVEPSREDIDVTKRIQDAGKIMGIEIMDHIIVGHENYISLRERGVI